MVSAAFFLDVLYEYQDTRAVYDLTELSCQHEAGLTCDSDGECGSAGQGWSTVVNCLHNRPVLVLVLPAHDNTCNDY